MSERMIRRDKVILPEPGFTPSGRAQAELLASRVEVGFSLPHNHPGIPGVAEGLTCHRCNAEKALNELVRRAKRHA